MSDLQRDALIDFANAVEAACVNLRMRLGDTVKPNPTQLNPATAEIAVNESNFAQLKWDPQKSDKMGDYEIAGKVNNDAAKFDVAYSVLQKSNATIKTRYHGQTYAYSYWLYGEGKIFRQKLKEKS